MIRKRSKVDTTTMRNERPIAGLLNPITFWGGLTICVALFFTTPASSSGLIDEIANNEIYEVFLQVNEILVEFLNIIERLESANNTTPFIAVNESAETVLRKVIQQFPILKLPLNILNANGVDFNTVDKAGNSSLFITSSFATLKHFGMKWDTRNKNSDTFLHAAALHGDLEAVNFFLSMGSDVNAQNLDWRTPLHQAILSANISNNTVDIVNKLLRSDAKANILDKQGETAMQLANRTTTKNYKLKNVILNVLSDACNKRLANIIGDLEQLKTNSPEISRKLFQIVQTEDLDTIKSVLAHLGNSSKVTEIWDEENPSLLHVAIKCQDYSVVEYLLNTGGFAKNLNDSKFNANLVQLCMEGINEVWLAAFEQKFKILQLLFSIQPDLIESTVVESNPFVYMRGTPLLYAAKCAFRNRGKVELIQMLIDNKADVNASSFYDNQTALHLAAYYNNPIKPTLVQIMKILIENHADANAVDRWGNTFLHYVAKPSRGRLVDSPTPAVLHETVEYLDTINNTDSFIIRNGRGETVLYNAVERLQVQNETLEIFRRRGVDFNAIDNHNKPILFESLSWKRNGSLSQRLIAFGADWRLRDDRQNTVLHVATGWGSWNAVKIFIQLGADVNAQNSDGNTPLHSAADVLYDYLFSISNLVDCVEELSKHGADVNIRSKSGLLAIDVPYQSLQRRFQFVKVTIIQRKLLQSHRNVVLHVAANFGMVDELKLGIRFGADVNSVINSSGETPLHYAFLNRDEITKFGLVSELVNHGANGNIQTKAGDFPRDLAQRKLAQWDILEDGVMDLLENMANRPSFNAVEVLESQFNESIKLKTILDEIEQLKTSRSFNKRIFQIVHTEHLHIIKRVLDHIGNSSDVTAIWAEDLYSLLHVAVNYRDYSIVEYLLNSQGFSRKLSDTEFSSALLSFCMKNIDTVLPQTFEHKFRILQLLFSIQPDLLETGFSTSDANENGELVPLLYSTTRKFSNGKQLELIQMLIDNNANINARNSANKTALHLAVSYNFLEPTLFQMFRILNENQADVNAVDISGNTFLHILADKSTPAVLHETVAYLESLNKTELFNIKSRYSNQTVLFRAVMKMDVWNETLEIFHKHGADLNAIDWDGYSILLAAIEFGRSGSVLKFLIEFGADWRLKTSGENTALHLAARYGNLDAVKLLLHLGADVNALNSDGNTPFQEALWYDWVVKRLEIVKELINYGADFNVRSKSGELPLDMAQRYLKEYTERILENEIIQMFEGNQYTPLHLAAFRGNLEMVKRLIKLGADVNAIGSNMETPLHSAFRNDDVVTQLDLVSELITHGANGNIRAESGVFPIDLAYQKMENGKLEDGIIELLENMKNQPSFNSTEVLDGVVNREVKLKAVLDQLDQLKPNSIEISRKLFEIVHSEDLDTIKSVFSHLGIRSDFHEIWARNRDSLVYFARKYRRKSVLDYLRSISIAEPPNRNFSKFTTDLVKLCMDNMNSVLPTGFEHKFQILQLLFSIQPTLIECKVELYGLYRKKEMGTPLLYYNALLFTNGNQLKLVKMLIDNNTNVNARTSERRSTALQLAAYFNPSAPDLVKIIKILVENHANANARDYYGNTVLYIVAEKSTPSLFHETVVYLDSINNTYSFNREILYKAVSNMDVRHETLEILQRRGVDILATVNMNCAIFCTAICTGRSYSFLKNLIALGAKWRTRDELGDTFLHLAASRGNLDAVKLLIQLGSDVNAQNGKGNTPLHEALEYHWVATKLDLVQELITHGAKVNIRNHSGELAIDVARISRLVRHIEDGIVQLL